MTIETDKLKKLVTPVITTVGQMYKNKSSVACSTKKNFFTKDGIVAYKSLIDKVFVDNNKLFNCASASTLPNVKYIRRYLYQDVNKIVFDFEFDCLAHVMGVECPKKITFINVMTQIKLCGGDDAKEFSHFVASSFMPYLFSTLFDDPYKEYAITIDRTHVAPVPYPQDPPKSTKPATVKFGIFTKYCPSCKQETTKLIPSYKMYISGRFYSSHLAQFNIILNNCWKCHNESCWKCHNEPHDHFSPCPKKLVPITQAELDEIQNALEDETARCPTCDHVCTKDDACDKVQCGRVDGGRQEGCGTTFCFRCSEIIDNHDYLTHLSVSQKPDGTDTHWVCRKFTRNCPSCSKTQFYDTTKDTIICGTCQTEFVP
jgi:hypothetical protein